MKTLMVLKSHDQLGNAGLKGSQMKKKPMPRFTITGLALALSVGLTLMAQQDRYALKVPNGLAFSEFKGYDAWQTIAVSETKTSVKAILGNPIMIQAYKEGVPDSGKLFPEGSKTVKIEWLKKTALRRNPTEPPPIARKSESAKMTEL
jgi:hypothetical protein